MRFLIMLATFALVVGFSPSANAVDFKCPQGSKLKKIGTVATANDDSPANEDHNISTSGHDVRMIIVSCGTACVTTLYDTDGSIAAGAVNVDAAVAMEPGAPANTSAVLTFPDTPFQFTEGITLVDDGNVNAVQLYECAI